MSLICNAPIFSCTVESNILDGYEFWEESPALETANRAIVGFAMLDVSFEIKTIQINLIKSTANR